MGFTASSQRSLKMLICQTDSIVLNIWFYQTLRVMLLKLVNFAKQWLKILLNDLSETHIRKFSRNGLQFLKLIFTNSWPSKPDGRVCQMDVFDKDIRSLPNIFETVFLSWKQPKVFICPFEIGFLLWYYYEN